MSLLPFLVDGGEGARQPYSGWELATECLRIGRSRHVPLALLVAGWALGIAALVCGLVRLVLVAETSNATIPDVELGLVIAAASPAVSLVGLAMVQTARARRLTVTPIPTPA